MKIILLQNVDGLGSQWEVKDVADGYARNFLLPKGMAKPATPADVEQAEKNRTEKETQANAMLKEVEDLVAKLDGYEIKIPIKVGDGGQLYAQLSSKQIVSALEAEGFSVQEKHVKISEPIKELGEFPVTLEFDHGLEAEIKVIVEALE